MYHLHLCIYVCEWMERQKQVESMWDDITFQHGAITSELVMLELDSLPWRRPLWLTDWPRCANSLWSLFLMISGQDLAKGQKMDGLGHTPVLKAAQFQAKAASLQVYDPANSCCNKDEERRTPVVHVEYQVQWRQSWPDPFLTCFWSRVRSWLRDNNGNYMAQRWSTFHSQKEERTSFPWLWLKLNWNSLVTVCSSQFNEVQGCHAKLALS